MKKDWLGRELTMEILVGVFMVTIMVGLGYFTIMLSQEKWFGAKELVEIRFSDVMGLRVGDSVVVRGMPVGKITAMTLDSSSRGATRVRVTATLEQKLPLRAGCRASVETSSMLGGRFLKIDEGPEENMALPPGTVVEGDEPYDLVSDVAEVMNEVKGSFIEGGVISNLQSFVEQLNQMATRVNEGKGMLGKLLSADDKLYNDLSETVASLKAIAARIEKGEGTLGKLMGSDDKIYRDLAAAAESLRNISASVERGEGTIGKLMKDDKLYNQIEKALDEVRATIDDYRETAPIVVFTDVFFGAL